MIAAALAVLSLAVSAQPAVDSAAKLVSAREIVPPAGGPFNPSGLLRWKGDWLVVSDKAEHRHLYRLKRKGEDYEAEPFLAIPELSGAGTRDFEGLADCAGKFLLVEESTGALLALDRGGAAELRPVDLASIHRERGFAPSWGSKGAGLEGVACSDDTIFVANERQYRMIYALDPKTMRARDFFDVPGAPGLPRFIGTTALYPDYADLFFEKGFLYALERNSRRVLKIDPASKTLVAAARLEFREKDYYEYELPFGMAEGLALEGGRIVVVLDNNDAARRGKPGHLAPMLLEFERPAGF